MDNVRDLRKYMFGFITPNKTYYIDCNDRKSLETFYSKGMDEELKEVKKYKYNESYINMRGGVVIENNHNKTT